MALKRRARPRAASPQAQLRELKRAFFTHLAAAQGGDAHAVHQLRVYGRRLRAALPLLARKPRGKRVRRARRALREIVRAAAASRDRDVMRRLLRDAPARGRQAEDIAALASRLRRSGQRARERLRTRFPVRDIYRLRALLSRATDRATRADVAFLRSVESCESRRQDLRVEVASLGARFDPARLHALRRRLRRLRYIVEVQDRLRGCHSTVLPELKAMQEQLGEMHDRWLLAEWLGARGATATAAAFLKDLRVRHRAWLDQGPAERIESLSLTPAPPA